MRVLICLSIVLLVAACSPSSSATPLAPTSPPTALPAADLTAEAERMAITPATAPPIAVENVVGFPDMAAGAAEFRLEGAFSIRAGAQPRASFRSVSATAAVLSPSRHLMITVPVTSRFTQEETTLTLTLLIPGGVAGALNLTSARTLSPNTPAADLMILPLAARDQAFGSDINALAVTGDVRVLENSAFISAAFEVTFTSGITGESVRVTGRVNQLGLIVE
jgi:hypothetical protein